MALTAKPFKYAVKFPDRILYFHTKREANPYVKRGGKLLKVRHLK